MSEPDMTDHWMNPPRREYRSITASRNYPRFLILRRRRLDHVPFDEWAEWQSFDVQADRDAVLAKLRAEHPIWQLMARDELHAPLAHN